MSEKRDSVDETLARMPKPMFADEKKQALLNRIVEEGEKDVKMVEMKKRKGSFGGIAIVMSIVLFGLLILTNEKFELFRSGTNEQPDVVSEPVGEIFQYDLEHVGTYVGSPSKVSEILSFLHGGDSIEKGFSLKDQMISVTYTKNEKWQDDDLTMEQKLLYNSIYLSIFVPNSQGFHFSVGDSLFSITREEMTKMMSEKLVDYPSQLDDFWNKDIIATFMERNKRLIMRDMIESEEFLEQFYRQHPITKME